MKFYNVAVLRDTLEQMETQQLDEMLHAELKKERPDGQLVRLIGSVLWERERDTLPEIDDNIQRAWEQYQRKTQPKPKKWNPVNSFLLKAASLVLVLLTLSALLPQKAEASNFFQRFIAWTSDVFSLLNPAETGKQDETYVFRTDNPGLQEVYDKVTELGVTVPVVPMWLPEGYELVECNVTNTPVKTYLLAVFSDGVTDAVYEAGIYNGNVTSSYSKSGKQIRVIEQEGMEYTLLGNNDLLVAVWTSENIECSIFIDCQEDILIRILESIYTMEENE